METIFLTSQDDLDKAVRQSLKGMLREVLPEIVRQSITKPFLTKVELMELTGWSSRQVEYVKSQRKIPFVRRRRLVLFPTDAVYAYLNEGFVPAKYNKPREGMSNA